MRRKFLMLAILPASLLILLILLRGRSPFGKANSSFAIEASKEITLIEISDANTKLSLEKAGGKWFVNSEAEARKSGISFITSVLTEMMIKSPVSEELYEAEIASRQIQPLTVRVYEQRKLLKSFIVYKTASNRYGNIMKLRSGSKPFIVHMPGFEGDIGAVFTMNELYWKPFVVFNLLPSSIASVELCNKADTSSSFTIVNRKGESLLYGNSTLLSGWDSSRVKRYLSYFAFIPFEGWATDLSDGERSIAEKQQPLYTIKVTDSGGAESILTLWKRNLKGVDGVTDDSDRLLGKMQGEEHFFIIRYFDIDPLLKKRSYFFPR